MLSHVFVFLCSGKVTSVPDCFGNKRHGVHQRLLRHGETSAKLGICQHFIEGPFKHVGETFARVSTGTSPQQGVHSEPDSSLQHGGRFLEDDLGTRHTHCCPSARHTLPGITHAHTHVLCRTYKTSVYKHTLSLFMSE